MRLALVLVLVTALAVPVATALSAKRPTRQVTLAEGRKLYRKYCGQCHALKEARAVGFGQDKGKTEPGPSLDSLRVEEGRLPVQVFFGGRSLFPEAMNHVPRFAAAEDHLPRHVFEGVDDRDACALAASRTPASASAPKIRVRRAPLLIA